MKKYLFLLLMFVFYLGLTANKKSDTKNVLNYADFNQNVIKFELLFDKEKNINEMQKIFENYHDDYQILNVRTSKKNYICHEKISACIKNIYDEENNDFNKLYISSGFSVRSLVAIGNKTYAFKFLSQNNLVYKELR